MNISKQLVLQWLDYIWNRTNIINEILIPYYEQHNIEYKYTTGNEDDEAIYQLFLTDQMPDKYVQEILEFSISNL